MSRKKNNNSKKSVSNGYVSKRIPSGMIHIGTADDGTLIYSASPLIMKLYYPDLYELKPNKADYVFTGKNGVYTPLGASNFTYDKFIDSSLLRYNLNTPKQVIKPKKVDNAEQVSTYGTGPAYSAYDPEHPVTESNIEKYIYWDPVNKLARWVLNRKELENRMFLNNLLEGTLLFGVSPLLALGLSNPATVLPTIGGLAGYMGGSTVLNDAWKTYVSPEHNTFDYDFGNAVVLPIRELFGDKNKASITDKNAEIVGSLLNPLGWITAKVGTNGGKAFNSLGAKTYNGIRNLSLELPESLYLSYLKPPTDEPINTRPTSGLMLKSLFEGNGLERLMLSNGDIKVKLIRLYMKTLSKSDLELFERALSKFGNQDRISYFQFKLEVQNLIPTFNRVSQTKFADYGMSRIGYTNRQEKDIWNRSLTYAEPEAYTFEDPLSTYPYMYYRHFTDMNKHFEGTPLGHSRTFTNPDEPNILYVMESLSDWALNIDLGNPRNTIMFDRDGTSNVMIDENGNYVVDTYAANLLSQNRNIILPKDKYIDYLLVPTEIEMQSYPQVNDPILLHMKNTYTYRQIYENMRRAAENGQTIMRYPTSETAFKILKYTEDYPPEFYNEAADLATLETNETNALYQELEKNFPEGYMSEYLRENSVLDDASPEEIADFRRRYELSEQWEKDNQYLLNNYRKLVRSVRAKYEALLDELKLKYPKRLPPAYVRILNKYNRFPSLFLELFKGQEVRTVYDDNNNSWFEIDVPKDFFEREWAFKKGGVIMLYFKNGKKIHIKESLKGSFTRYCGGNVTSECIARGKASPDPKIRKKATFADNARKWKHQEGGFINYANIKIDRESLNPYGKYTFGLTKPYNSII